MSDKAIIVSDLHKRYDLGSINSGTVKDDLKIWWSRIRGQEDPTKLIGDDKNGKEYWALKGVDFEINKGESVGIIGKNGAGKSTLLKLLSRVTTPTKGEIKVKGRIASLLEVGTGFHPDLSGRENIYMNGAILGMTRNEITSKLDEIIAFSGVEKYVDTPVKRYSSGMYVRLAFAVAAHLESEILIVDEVLAVGDAEFQKKCLGKMNDVSSKDGRTVLFVSHNMAAVKGLCTSGIYLNKGVNFQKDIIENITSKYLADNINNVSYEYTSIPNSNIYINSIRINNRSNFNITNTDKIQIEFQIAKTIPQNGFLELAGSIKDENEFYIHYFSSKLKGKVYQVSNEITKVVLEFESLPFISGDYYFTIELKFNSEIVFYQENAFKVKVTDNDFYHSGINWAAGKVLLNQNWN